jgi:hypothetical protein
MMPHVKNVLLASADQVAIDAVAARIMGFDPMKIKFIRLAHEKGLGCGDPREIQIVGDREAADQRWSFVGPYKKMTFASRMQHKIYWGPLKKPIEWSLKTFLAPWAYVASVMYHDSFWYPVIAKHRMQETLDSPWGRLFRGWENMRPDEQGFPEVGESPAILHRTGLKAFGTSLRLLGTCVKESPEFLKVRRRRRAAQAR